MIIYRGNGSRLVNSRRWLLRQYHGLAEATRIVATVNLIRVTIMIAIVLLLLIDLLILTKRLLVMHIVIRIARTSAVLPKGLL